MRDKKIKVCFILPEKAEDTATHFAHKWELIQELKNDIDFMDSAYQPFGRGIFKIFFARFRGCKTYYVHYSFKGAIIARLATVFGGKVFYWNCGMPWLYKRGWFEEWLFWNILRHTILVIGTEKLAGEYAKRYGLDRKNIRVVPNYIRVSRVQQHSKVEMRKKLGIPLDKKVVLFLHRLSRRKGAHLLPEIIKQFHNGDDVLFLVVGDGPERRTIEARITNYELWEKTRLEGLIPNYKVPQYITAADVYLMPSEEEGMPNALLEAMAVGVPFVASNVGSVREMTPPDLHEYTLPYGDTHAFVEKIKKLLADEELCKRISVEEQEWVKQYDVSVVAPKYLELFLE